MAKYHSRLRRAISAANTTVGSLAVDGVTPRRQKIHEIIVGTRTNPPVSAQFELELQRFTAPGTSTPVVPRPDDPADATALADTGEDHTVEPTYTVGEFLLELPFNQQATIKWQCSPGNEIVIPAVASNGVGCLITVAPALAAALTVSLGFEEQ